MNKVCSKCQIELKPLQNGVYVVTMATFGPSELHSADEWYCPSCGWKGIFGFSNPFAFHYEPDFKDRLAKIEKNQVVYQFWINMREKMEYRKNKYTTIIS